MIPARVLLARLEHELERAALTLAARTDADDVAASVARARELAEQLRETL